MVHALWLHHGQTTDRHVKIRTCVNGLVNIRTCVSGLVNIRTCVIGLVNITFLLTLTFYLQETNNLARSFIGGIV